MSNTIDTTRPSYLGIPQCINETVSISNDLAQCVGTDARWPSAVRRSMTGEVAGECYKTDTALPETVNMIKHGQLMQAKLTAEEVTADKVGRAVVQYRYRLQMITPILPRRDALFALYVPRWQTTEERISVKDYAGTHDLSINGNVTWSAGGSLIFDSTTRGNYLVSDTFAYTRNDYTIIADRTLNESAEAQSLGLRMVYNLNNEYATDTMTMYRSTAQVTCESGGRDNRIAMTDVPQDGYSVMTREQYNGVPTIEGGGRRAWRRIDINVYHIYNANYRRPMWEEVRALAIWTVQLTAEEIEQAKQYLSYAPRPADI